MSFCVHALLSVHEVPFDLAGLLHTPVDVLHVPAVWHWSSALQVTGLAPTQLPDWHVSLWVHALPSLHPVPLPALGLLQTPVPVLQTPAVWHWSEALHVTGLAPVQTPVWQVSLCVQALASLHPVPLLAFGLLHTPVPVLQIPAVWHWSEALHVTGLAPVHTPVWQVSLCVHALPSLQPVPLLTFGLLHTPVPVLQIPAVWHWSEALHVTGLAPVHAPAWQVSLWVHALPSLHPVPLLALGLLHTPVPVLQTPAVWHWSEALHVTGLEPTQLPPEHVSL